VFFLCDDTILPRIITPLIYNMSRVMPFLISNYIEGKHGHEEPIASSYAINGQRMHVPIYRVANTNESL
jgi:hypothetical protein